MRWATRSRSLTVHDISHSDALWQICDLIVGDAFSVTPIEAFILGASFLIHDAGLFVAAFENAGLLGSPIWRDNLALALRRAHGRPATSVELDNPDESIKRSVLEVRKLKYRFGNTFAFLGHASKYSGRICDREHPLGGAAGALVGISDRRGSGIRPYS